MLCRRSNKLKYTSKCPLMAGCIGMQKLRMNPHMVHPTCKLNKNYMNITAATLDPYKSTIHHAKSSSNTTTRFFNFEQFKPYQSQIHSCMLLSTLTIKFFNPKISKSRRKISIGFENKDKQHNAASLS